MENLPGRVTFSAATNCVLLSFFRQLKFHEDGAERVLSGYRTRVALAGLLGAIINQQTVQLPGGEELIDVSSAAEIIRAASVQRNVSFCFV